LTTGGAEVHDPGCGTAQLAAGSCFVRVEGRVMNQAISVWVVDANLTCTFPLVCFVLPPRHALAYASPNYDG